jgi:TPR repeat protein
MLRTALVAAFALVAAPALAQDKPRKVAFLVGVGKYDFAFTDLGKAPENDVTELAKVLKDGGFEVVVLTSTAAGKDRATKANVEERFKAILDGGGGMPALKKADTLLVHLCGHGVQAEAVDPATGKKEEQPFFCPADAKPDAPATMVPLNGLIRAVEPSGATALFLVDACREVRDANRSRTGIQGKKVNLPAKTAVLFACGQGQLSHQSEAKNHGLFTYAVLQTLEGKTGLTGDVSWTDLVGGVEKSFRTQAFASMLPTGRTQTPFEAKGELSYTDLLSIAPKAAGTIDADYNAVAAELLKGGSVRAHISDFTAARVAEWGKAADAGDPKAAFLYAASLDRGTAITRNEVAATGYYQKAADKNEPRALFALWERYRTGVGGVKIDEKQAERLIKEAAAAGCPKAMIRVAEMYCLGQGVGRDVAQARQWLDKALKAGDLDAQDFQAQRTETGHLGQPANPAAAFDLHKKAADAGHVWSMHTVALKLSVRFGVPDDLAQAKVYQTRTREAATKLAHKGDVMSMAMLATWLEFELMGCNRNLADSFGWRCLAGDAGDVYSMFRAGEMYETGVGTTANAAEALKWYRKSAARGFDAAAKAADRLGKK